MYLKLSKKRLTITGLEEDEETFHNTHKDYKGTKWNFTKGYFPNTIGLKKQNGDESFFYKSKYHKKHIVVHGTHGFLSNDIANLSKSNYHVSTAYVIGRSGYIYELFNPYYWSYHLGGAPRGAGWSNTTLSKTTVAIEMSNFLCLKEHSTKPDILLDYWNFPYCMKDNTEYYDEVEEYRGYKYYASFTDDQYKALDSLLLKLCREFDIPHTFTYHKKRFDFSKNIPKFDRHGRIPAGIWLHSNVRSDKWDMPPSFDFSLVSGR